MDTARILRQTWTLALVLIAIAVNPTRGVELISQSSEVSARATILVPNNTNIEGGRPMANRTLGPFPLDVASTLDITGSGASARGTAKVSLDIDGSVQDVFSIRTRGSAELTLQDGDILDADPSNFSQVTVTGAASSTWMASLRVDAETRYTLSGAVAGSVGLMNQNGESLFQVSSFEVGSSGTPFPAAQPISKTGVLTPDGGLYTIRIQTSGQTLGDRRRFPNLSGTSDFDLTVTFDSCLVASFARGVCESRIIWETPTSGEFENPDKWLPDVVPGAGATAVFNQVGTYTVALTEDHSVAAIEVRGGDVSVTLASLGESLTANALSMGLDSTDDILLTLDDVKLRLPGGTATLGAAEGGDATLRLINDSEIHAALVNVGTVEEGHLKFEDGSQGNIQRLRIADERGNGSTVSVASTAMLFVNDSVEIGVGKRGEFRVEQAGFVGVLVDSTTAINDNSALEVRGNAATWSQSDGDATIGWGKLTVADKAAASFRDLNIWPVSGDETGTVEVLAESMLTVGRTLNIGALQGGSLTVHNSELIAHDVNVGEFHTVITDDDEVARLTINNAGATFNGAVTVGSIASSVSDSVFFGAELRVDQEGFVTVNDVGTTTVRTGGLLDVVNGFWVQQDGDLSVESGVVSVKQAGTLEFDRIEVRNTEGMAPGVMAIGGVARARETVTVGGSGEGQLILAGGEIQAEEELRVLTGGKLLGIGTARARHFDISQGTVSPTVQQVLSPARGVPDPIGTLVLDGDYTQSNGGTMLLDVAGTKEGEFDVIEITGDAVIEGAVILSFIDGFAPKAGQAFGSLLDVAGNADVSNAQFIVQNLAGDFEYDITPMDSGFMLTALTDGTFQQAIPGDYDNSGQVEQADLDLVLLNWGASATRIPAGWINGLPTGNIDQNELDAVLLNWGNTAAGTTANSVPEPSMRLLTLLLAASIWLAKRHARRSNCERHPSHQ